MRGIDHQYVIDVNAHWEGNKKVTRPDCVMMRHPLGLWAYLHKVDFRPGHELCPCPHCGGEHRWTVLSRLLDRGFEFMEEKWQIKFLDGEGAFPAWARKRQAQIRKDYPEGYRQYQKNAQAYFDSVINSDPDSGNNTHFYTL